MTNDSRNFASKKSAVKAVRRDTERLPDSVEFIRWAVSEGGGGSSGYATRWYVTVYLAGDSATYSDEQLASIAGFNIVFERPDRKDPAPTNPDATEQPPITVEDNPKTKTPAKPKKPLTRRTSGQVNTSAKERAYPCKEGTKQAAIVDLLARKRGADLDELRAVCIKKDGTPWDDYSIKSALYYDVQQKGYGVRTEVEGGAPRYHLVYPEDHSHTDDEGNHVPVPHTPKKKS